MAGQRVLQPSVAAAYSADRLRGDSGRAALQRQSWRLLHSRRRADRTRGRPRDAGSPAHAETGWHWLRSTSFEARRMFAAIAVVLALGPVIAITSHNHAGPLSTVGLLMSPVSVDDGHARALPGRRHAQRLLPAIRPDARLDARRGTALAAAHRRDPGAGVGPVSRTSVRGHLRRGHQPGSRRALPSPITWSCR